MRCDRTQPKIPRIHGSHLPRAWTKDTRALTGLQSEDDPRVIAIKKTRAMRLDDADRARTFRQLRRRRETAIHEQPLVRTALPTPPNRQLRLELLPPRIDFPRCAM